MFTAAPLFAQSIGTPSVAVRPVAPVHIGESTQFDVSIRYEGVTAPPELKVLTDIGVISSAERIDDDRFQATLFVPPFNEDDEIEVGIRPGGVADARRRILRIQPAAYAVENFVPAFAGKLTPDRVILGETRAVTVEVQLSDTSREPYTRARLTADVNTGTISEFRQTARGVYQATYIPPDQFHPDVAMVVIRDARHGMVEMLPISLWGQENFPIDARPGSEVRLVVGAETFGPVKTNFRGVARIPIIVAPGIASATQFENLPDGKTLRRVVDLAVPSIQRFHAVFEPKRMQAGGQAKVHVFPTPLPNQTISGSNISIDLQAEQGEFERLRQRKPGHYIATYNAPLELIDPTTDIFVIENIVDRPKELLEFETQRAYLTTVEFFPAFPQKLSVIAAPARLLTKQPPERVFATVEIVDRYGNPVPNLEITGDLPGAEIGPIEDQGDGRYQIGIYPTEEVNTTQRATFTVRSPSIEHQANRVIATEEEDEFAVDTSFGDTTEPEPEAVFEMKVAYAKPEKINFLEPPTTLPGGFRERKIQLEILDKDGNRISGEELAANASRGVIVSVGPAPDDTYALVYRTPERGDQTISITVREKTGEFTETLRIQIIQKPLEISLLPAFGYILNSGLNRTARITAKVDMVSHAVARGRLGLQAGVSFWGRNNTIDVDLAGGTVQTKTFFWVTPLHLGLISYLPVPKVDVHLGATANFYLVSAGQIPLTQQLSASSEFTSTIGAEGHMRIAFPLGPGKPFADFSYAWADLDSASGASGNIGGFSLMAGYLFSF